MSKEELKKFMSKLKNRMQEEFPNFNEPKITARGDCFVWSINRPYTFNIAFRTSNRANGNKITTDVYFRDDDYKAFIQQHWTMLKEHFAKEYSVCHSIKDSYTQIHIESAAYISKYDMWNDYIEETIRNIHILYEISENIVALKK